MEERRGFYVGVKPCGCVTASLVDDADTTAKDVADFSREMHKTGRKVQHMELTKDEFMAQWKKCDH
ncbi:MAG: hypothetical protein H6948_15175 [Zoogloeaceae bacterium]|nr:hypothetical protein [Zoogloeaceae bacterium]